MIGNLEPGLLKLFCIESTNVLTVGKPIFIQGLGVALVPYAPLLVVPLLRCMSDCDQSVRQSVTRSFAALVPLLPLARGVPQPIGIGEGISKMPKICVFWSSRLTTLVLKITSCALNWK